MSIAVAIEREIAPAGSLWMPLGSVIACIARFLLMVLASAPATVIAGPRNLAGLAFPGMAPGAIFG